MRFYTNLVFAIAFLLCASCNNSRNTTNTLTDKEKEEGWILLFDGQSAHGWHLYNEGNVPSVWEVENGELTCKPKNKKQHGDLITDDEFKNFDLKFEWKMKGDGNSGVFINVLEKDTLPAAWFSGPEYQLLGNTHPDNAVANKRAGCMFGFSAQKNNVTAKPEDEWNESRIKQVNGKVQFYLNGILTTEEDFTSPQWRAKIAQSTFNTKPEFGKYIQGHIGLQDWAKGIAFRNIKIKKL